VLAALLVLVVACTTSPGQGSPRVTPPPEVQPQPTAVEPGVVAPGVVPTLEPTSAALEATSASTSSGQAPVPTLVPTVVARQTADPTAVVIFAASTFGSAFSELGSQFMLAAPETTGVSYRFDTSATLRSMIERGADADVFASLEADQMDALRQDNLLDGAPSVLARDQLVIVVSQANPQHLQNFKDLANDGVRFIVAAPSSPTTVAMLAAFDAASADADASYGADFRQKADRNVLARDGDDHLVVSRIIANEVTAGVVYASSLDPQSRSQVQVIPLPDAYSAPIDYPIAVLKNASNTRGGQAFLKYILSGPAQDILSKHGFAKVGATNATR